MKKYGFTLIELIFVIILMGVLTGIGFYMSQPDATKQDAQYTLLKLKEARYRAIGYETGNTNCSDGGWITLTQTALSTATDNNDSMHREIKSLISPDSTILTNGSKTLCFDSLGRPHDGNSTSLVSLIRNPLDINFIKSDKNTTIRLFPQTGYAIIPCK